MLESYFIAIREKEFSHLLKKENGLSKKIFTYIFAVFVSLLGIVFKIFLIHAIHYNNAGLLISLGTIMISAWYGGLGPGLVSVFLNYFIIDWIFITPGLLFFNDSLSDKIRFTIFLIEGILISWLFESLHKAHQKTKEILFIIKQNERLFRSLIADVADHAIFLVDVKGNIKTWSEGAEKVTGYQQQEVLQKPLSFLFLPKNSKRNPSLLKKLHLASAKGQYKLEGWNMRKDQSLYWTETIITALPAKFPEEQHFSIIMHDSTARKQADDLKNDFFSIITHELRTPISIMNMVVEDMVDRFSHKPRLSQELPNVFDLQGEVNRLTLLVDNILDLSRARSRKLSFNFHEIDLSTMLTNVATKMQLVAGDNAIIIVHQTKSVMVTADKGKLEQVLMNLLDNAIRYTPLKGKIKVKTSLANGKVIVFVENEAMKEIPKDKDLLIFDKYYQLARKPVRGLGLGLYLSKEIVKHHKGDLWMDSNSNKKTVFAFSLPTKRVKLST